MTVTKNWWTHSEIQRQIWKEAVHVIKINKWGFKFWFRKSGYLYTTPEFNLGLGEEVVLQLTKDLERSFCTVCFDNFFNSPMLIENLFQKGIYGIGTVRANRKQMAKMIDEKHISKGRLRVPYSGNAVACK